MRDDAPVRRGTQRQREVGAVEDRPGREALLGAEWRLTRRLTNGSNGGMTDTRAIRHHWQTEVVSVSAVPGREDATVVTMRTIPRLPTAPNGRDDWHEGWGQRA